MRGRGTSARAVAALGLASLVLVAVIVVAPMPASAAPTATINSPLSAGTYSVGQVVPTAFFCAVDVGDSLASCSDGTSTSGSGVLDTSTPGGPFTYTVTATSVNNVVGIASISYTVAAPTDTVTFNAEGGSAETSINGSDGSNVALPTPTRSGFTLNGWFSAATGGTQASTSYTLAGDVTLYAQWTAVTDTVTFNAEGGSTVSSMGGSDGSTITLPGAPTRSGFTFNGWFSAATGGAQASTSYTLAGNVTLYAQWTAATDNYSYNAAGGTPTPAAGSGLNGTSITLASAPTRAGYVFDDWSDGSANYAASISYPLSSEGAAIVFTAQWTANATGGGPPLSGTTLDQTSPTSGVTTSDNSGTFTGGPITVSNATGAVSFVINSSSIALRVSPQGAITTSGALLAGSYRISGTDSDPNGDTGTWTFTLAVFTPITVTFVANGGQGSMSPETKSASTALTPNVFTRAKHAFTKWNTAADGSGTSYANGATYLFIAKVTLYAQWTATKHRAVSHRLTFDANGGTGTMAVQSNSVLTLLKTNAFTRAGYAFKGWNTTANGSGTSYADGAAYSFAKSTTLYAQWTKKVKIKVKIKVTIKVTFDANGGTGTMAVQSNNVLTLLKTNAFTRAGYTFKGWNTTANGSGTSYAKGAAYSFAKSAILYAQWTKKAVVIIPAVHGVVTLSPFVGKTATLSSTLKAQVTVLAADIKANHDTKIALEGFSGNLTTANESNEEMWATSLKLARARADAVETFLEQQLATIGVTGYTITAIGSIAAMPVSSSATAASRAKNDKVVATLT